MALKIVTQEETQAIRTSWALHDGVIVWARNANGGKKIGDPVGFSTRKSGHKNVFLHSGGKLRGYVYARVVWLLHYGEWPSTEVDHIDCNSQNDKIQNLRLATRSQNCHNTRYGRADRPFKGTFQDRRNGKWNCQIQVNGKVHGRYGFSTQQEAYEARLQLAVKLHGEFAR
jgi:hypothetical protein